MSKTHFIIPFFIPHVGCPYSCIFCNQNRITGRESSVSPEEILPTIEQYLATFPPGTKGVEVAFFGGSFTGIPIRLQNAFLEKAYYAKKNGLIEGIRMSTRPDYIDQTILNRLKKYRVDTIELGVQSMSDHVLDNSCRGHTSEDVIRASKLIRENKFTLGLQMMIGLPGSDRDTEIETARQICRLKPTMVRIYPALVIRGTTLEVMYSQGQYKPPDLENAVQTCAVIAEMFIRENINIIRIGLQPTYLINTGKEVVAGPFHPSFRQLVDSLLLRKSLKKVLDQRGIDPKIRVVIEVNPSMLSTLQGIRKNSVAKLREEFPGIEERIAQNKCLGKTVIKFWYNDSCFEIDYNQVLSKG